jgi:hypothetical protein
VSLAPRRAARARVKADEDWRRRLEKGDEVELLKWVGQSGLERVARIVAALNDLAGKPGQPKKLDTLLLLKMAHLKQQQPKRTLHAIAKEVVSEAISRRGMGAFERASMVSKLEHDFREHRQKWTTLAGSAPEPSSEDINQDGSKSKTTNEFRALARIVGLLPNKIGLYDMLLADAKKLGSEEAKLVRAFRRERAEPLLADAIKLQAMSPFVMNAQGVPIIPRNLFELIGAELEQYRQEFEPRRRRPKNVGVLPVGRK